MDKELTDAYSMSMKYKERGGIRPALCIKKANPVSGTGSVKSPFRLFIN